MGAVRLEAVATCGQCGASYQPWKEAQRFCSRSCSWAAQSRAVTVTCTICGVAVRVPTKRVQLAKRLYCSKVCQSEGARRFQNVYMPKPCESCGATFVPNGPGQRACSSRCRRALGQTAPALPHSAEIACDACGTWFHTPIRMQRYCDGCREERSCISCGARYRRRGDEEWFCSSACARTHAPAWAAPYWGAVAPPAGTCSLGEAARVLGVPESAVVRLVDGRRLGDWVRHGDVRRVSVPALRTYLRGREGGAVEVRGHEPPN